MVTMYMSGVSLLVQYLTNLGLMASGGQLNTYVGGSVNTPVTTYTDSTGVVPNANPMALNSVGRPTTPSGALSSFWVPGGTTVKLVVYDAAGNLLVQIDNIPAINDLTNSTSSLTTLLASAASSNSSGSGPVAGVDLVANAVKSYDVFADVRAANAPVLGTGQTLNIEVQGGSTVNDGLGGQFYWSPSSTATDDSRTVLKPASVATATAGRWLRLYPLGVPVILVRSTDQSVTSSTVLVNDTTLAATLQSGTYLVQMRCNLLGVGGTGQGYKVQPNFSGSVSGPTCGSGVTSANAVAAATQALVNATSTAAAISSSTGDDFNQDFVLVVSAGTFTVQFAQNSSSANATVMKAGSALIVTRLA